MYLNICFVWLFSCSLQCCRKSISRETRAISMSIRRRIGRPPDRLTPSNCSCLKISKPRNIAPRYGNRVRCGHWETFVRVSSSSTTLEQSKFYYKTRYIHICHKANHRMRSILYISINVRHRSLMETVVGDEPLVIFSVVLIMIIWYKFSI